MGTPEATYNGLIAHLQYRDSKTQSKAKLVCKFYVFLAYELMIEYILASSINMTFLRIIDTFFREPTVWILIFSGGIWLLKVSIKKVLEKELEIYKRELDLKYQHLLSLQDHRRKLFEEFISSLEEMFGDRERDPIALSLNKILGLMALYAPDEVYRSLAESFFKEGTLLPHEAKPKIYITLRKQLFGEKTNLKEEEIKHIPGASLVPVVTKF